MKSTTPRTDAQHGPIIENYGKMVPAYFARELEEDLARVTAKRDALEIHVASVNTQIASICARAESATPAKHPDTERLAYLFAHFGAFGMRTSESFDEFIERIDSARKNSS